MPTIGVAVVSCHAGEGWSRLLFIRGEVFGVRFPGQEPFQGRAGQGLSCVPAASVEVGREAGDDVQACHLRGRGDGPDRGGVPG